MKSLFKVDSKTTNYMCCFNHYIHCKYVIKIQSIFSQTIDKHNVHVPKYGEGKQRGLL